MSNISNQNQKENKLSKKDVYNRLWKGRDFEIEHLWQRSVFLGAFLILFFTVYFAVIGSVFSDMEDSKTNSSSIISESTTRGTTFTFSEKEIPESGNFVEYLIGNRGINLLLLSIAFLGSSFSLLWIFMAKGSKYWYEKYERSIDEMHNDEELFDDDINREWHIEEAKARLEHREAHYIPIQGYMPHKDSDDSVFSHNGGAYSMSKVNVSIGSIFSLFWFLVSGFHLSFFLVSFLSWWIPVLAAVLFIIFTLVLGIMNLGGESNLYEPLGLLKIIWKELFGQILRNRSRIINLTSFVESKENYRNIFVNEYLATHFAGMTSKDSVFKTIRKQLKNDETAAELQIFFEEKMFSHVMPQSLQGEWTERNGRKINFAPENIKGESDFLFDIGLFHASNLKNRQWKCRVFASFPEKELMKTDKEGKFDKTLADTDDWTIYYILCDDIDNVICYEKFNFHHRADRDCLNSVLVNHDGVKLGEYTWWKPKQIQKQTNNTTSLQDIESKAENISDSASDRKEV